MSTAWTIIDADEVEKTVADWGLGEVVRERINQVPDVVTFRAEGRASDADPIFAFGSTVRLLQNGTPWFYGRVVQVPGRAGAKAEDQLYRLAGPWWYLENLVCQQTWQTTNGTDPTLVAVNKSRLILSQAADGTKLATGAAILEVLAYATARGVPITVGTVTPNAIAPYAEALDRSCAEVIRNLLRWTPDAMVAFDYTTTPYPTLSIHRRADAATMTLPAYGAPISGLELTPRYDLQVPAVVLKFEQTNDIDNDTFTSLIVQAAPSDATGDELGALVMTLDLAGARATYQKQLVRTAFIPPSDTSAGVVDWWKGKFAWLKDFDDADLTVVSGTQTIAIEHPENYPGITLSNVPNELLEGSVASWMNLNAAPLLVSATMQYTGAATDESSAVFGVDNKRVLYTRVVGTNAETQTYSRLTSETEAEAVPTGLAQALYDAASVLQYDGVIELTEQECSGAGAPGLLLNLTGGRAEWATMAAQIQRVEEKIDLGLTKITVGPAKQLGHAELTTWLRANRNRRVSFRLQERTTGSGSGNAAKVQGGEQLPRSDSVYRPSAGGAAELNRPFQLIDASDASGLKVSVNANSFLQQSLTPNDTFAITGLGAAMAVSVGTQVWLEIDFTDYAATAAAIGSGSGGWSGFPAPFVYTGDYPDQVLTTTFLLLGYLAAADSALDGTVISGGPTEATVSATNVIVSGSFTAPSGFTLPFSKITSTPTSLSGYGITDPVALTSGSYANPSWITSLAYAKLTGTPAGYTLPVATSSILGGVKQGSNVTIAGDGTVSVAAPVTSLPFSSITSTPTTMGGYGITDGVTLSGAQTLTNKSIDAGQITGTLGGGRIPTSTGSTSISTAGNTNLSSTGRTNSNTVTLGAGSGTYTSTLSLVDAGANAGDLYFVNVSFPASTNPTLQIYDNSTSGTLLVTSAASGTAGSTTFTFHFNGTSWEKYSKGAPLLMNNLSDLPNAATARTNLGLGTLATQSGTFSGTSSGTNTGDQTAGTGLTLSGGAFSVNTSQNIATLSNLTTDGFVYALGGGGGLNSGWTIAPTSATSAAAFSLTAGSYTGSGTSNNGGSFTLSAGNTSGTTSASVGGNVTITSGSGTGSGAIAGNVSIQVGTKSGPTVSSINIGTTATTNITLGSSTAGTTAINGNIQIKGTTAAGNVSAGCVGEAVSSLLATSSAVSLTSATAKNITSISLTAGDWDVMGNVNFNLGSTATVTQSEAGISTTSGTLPADGSEVYSGLQGPLAAVVNSIALPRVRINVSSTTTVYLVGQSNFGAGTVTGFGAITARRVR